jgi:hypothetical protein
MADEQTHGKLNRDVLDEPFYITAAKWQEGEDFDKNPCLQMAINVMSKDGTETGTYYESFSERIIDRGKNQGRKEAAVGLENLQSVGMEGADADSLVEKWCCITTGFSQAGKCFVKYLNPYRAPVDKGDVASRLKAMGLNVDGKKGGGSTAPKGAPPTPPRPPAAAPPAANEVADDLEF